MSISQKALDEFKRLYKKHFGEVLNDAVALGKAERLLRLVEVVQQSKAERRRRLSSGRRGR